MNVSRGSPVAEFARLAAVLGGIVAVLGAVLYFGGGRLARLVPVATERAWVGNRVVGFELQACGTDHARIEAYVARLSGELTAAMDLPPGTVTPHYSELDVPNAFATLGGHIVVTSGLYERLPSENALAMVLAHEIGHVQARDPIAALGGSATLNVMLALLTGQGDALGPHVVRLVQLGYSRHAERLADEAATRALVRHYGHAGGGAGLFEVLADYKGTAAPSVPSLLSTHPADAERIERLEAAAASWDPSRQPLVALQVPADSGAGCG